MAIKSVYQTLEDRGNYLIIEEDGPYPCKWDNSWLGQGFYFWDSFLSNAHWWGKDIRKYSSGYIICKAICDYNEVECCDLVNNIEHLEMLQNTYDLLKQKGIVNKKTTVARLIQYLKSDINVFKFDAIRACGILSKSRSSLFSYTLNFEANKTSYLDFNPPIQICFYKKTSLNLRDYKIIYPDEYIDGYLV